MRVRSLTVAADATGTGRAAGLTGRRVLMMCYFFPPIHSVGVNRSVGFARNLPGFGWTPTVLSVTRSRIRWERTGAPVPDDVDIVRAAEWDLPRAAGLADGALRRIFRLLGARDTPRILRSDYWLPDTQVAWRSYKAAVHLARQSDCVYASCSPFSAAMTAVHVARRCGKPLVLDFRDPWLGDGFQRRFERRVVERADALILNTPRTKAEYEKRFPHLASRMVVIPNGFDTLAQARQAPPGDGPFTVVHVGEFFASRQPDTLLEALAELNLPDVQFIQVGPTWPSRQRYEARVNIRHIDAVPRDEALALMQSASLLYLKLHRDAAYASMAVPAKTYEYLASGIPILAECDEGAVRDLIRDYDRDAELVAPDHKDALKAAVLRAYGRRHSAAHGVNPLFAARYNRKALTARLAAVFDAVVAGQEPDSLFPA